MTEQSYPSLFTLTIDFIPMSIERLLCDFDYKPSEKLAQVISAVQMKRLFSADCITEVPIVNIIKGSKFNWCSSHKLCIMLSYSKFH